MARPGQLEFIEDLLAKHGLELPRDLPEFPDDFQGLEAWSDVEALDDEAASELIEWLKDYGR